MRLILILSLLLLAVPASAQCPDFIRGDTDQSGFVDITDVNNILRHLFFGWEPCNQFALDTNADGLIDISDALYLLSYLFLGGPEPPAPFLALGSECTKGEAPCRLRPIEKVRVLGGSDVFCNRMEFLSESNYGPCRNNKRWDNFEQPEPLFVSQLSCEKPQGGLFELSLDRDCYQDDRCTTANAVFSVTDTHFVTPKALRQGKMSIYLRLSVLNVLFSPNFTQEGETSFCTGASDRINIIGLSSPDITLYFKSEKTGRRILAKTPDELFWDDIPPYMAYNVVEEDNKLAWQVLDQSNSAAFDSKPYWGDPTEANLCISNLVFSDNPSDCDLLKLEKVRVAVPAYFDSDGQDLIYEVNGLTEGVSLELFLNDVRYEFPNCPQYSLKCTKEQ